MKKIIIMLILLVSMFTGCGALDKEGEKDIRQIKDAKLCIVTPSVPWENTYYCWVKNDDINNFKQKDCITLYDPVKDLKINISGGDISSIEIDEKKVLEHIK